MRASLSQRESAGTRNLYLRSCHSQWIFDIDHRRFRRLPADISLDISGGDDWQPFEALHIDPHTGAFRITLNRERTRVLRSWLHDEPCRHCGAPVEVSLVDDPTAVTGELLLH